MPFDAGGQTWQPAPIISIKTDANIVNAARPLSATGCCVMRTTLDRVACARAFKAADDAELEIHAKRPLNAKQQIAAVSRLTAHSIIGRSRISQTKSRGRRATEERATTVTREHITNFVDNQGIPPRT